MFNSDDEVKRFLEERKYSALSFCFVLEKSNRYPPLVKAAPVYGIAKYIMKLPPEEGARENGLRYLAQYSAVYGSFHSQPIEDYLFKNKNTELMKLYLEKIYTDDRGYGYRRALIYIFNNDLQALRTLEDVGSILNGSIHWSGFDDLLNTGWIDAKTAKFLIETCWPTLKLATTAQIETAKFPNDACQPAQKQATAAQIETAKFPNDACQPTQKHTTASWRCCGC